MRPDIDLVINTFERTYREVLKSGFFAAVEKQNLIQFCRKVVLINNVNNLQDAKMRAQILIESGELDAFYVVSDLIQPALKCTGLSVKTLGRLPYYSTGLLVAINLKESPWLVYWDAEIHLETPFNWIDPSIDMIEEDPRILIANPNWKGNGLKKETVERSGYFSLGYGFSDHVFLARRKDLAQPIYSKFCVASLRYPLSHISSVLEQRIDAWMRTHRRLRATYKNAIYIHPDNEGHSYPPEYIHEKFRKQIHKYLYKLGDSLPTNNPELKITPKKY